MHVDHVAIGVGDLDATMALYEETLGLHCAEEVTGEDGTVHRYLRGADETAIQFIHDPNAPDPIDPSGIEHIALAVSDVDDRVDAVERETECRVVQPPTTVEDLGRRYAFIEDPDGYVVELFRRFD